MHRSALFESLKTADPSLAKTTDQVWDAALALWANAGQSELTDHGAPHIRQVIANLDALTAQLGRLTGGSLEAQETAVLLCAACLHDIGMLFPLKDARKDHAQHAYTLVANSWAPERESPPPYVDLSLPDRTMREAAAQVARAHWAQYALQLPETDFLGGGAQGRLRLLGLMLAMSDLLDLSPGRAWYYRRPSRLRELPGLSELHQRSHDLAKGLTIAPASPPDPHLRFTVAWHDSPDSRRLAEWRGYELERYFAALEPALRAASGGAVLWSSPWRDDRFDCFGGQLPGLREPARALLAELIADERAKSDVVAALETKVRTYGSARGLLTVPELCALFRFRDDETASTLDATSRGFILRSALGAWPLQDFPGRADLLAAPGWWAADGMPREELISIVRDAVHDPAPSVQACATELIGVLGDASDLEALRPALRSGHLVTWEAAVLATARLGGPRVRVDVENTLRFICAPELRTPDFSRIPEDRRLPLPRWFVTECDQEAEMAEVAVEALRFCGNRYSARLLRSLLGAGVYGLCEAIGESIVSIETNGDPERTLQIARDADEEADVRAAAIGSLASVLDGPPAGLLDDLEGMAVSGDEMDVREAALGAVIAMDPGRGLSIIERLLDTDQIGGRYAIYFAVQTGDWGEPTPDMVERLRALRGRLFTSNWTTADFVLTGIVGTEEDLPALQRGLSADDDYERQAAARAIARVELRANGVPGLEVLLTDSRRSVASAAASVAAAAATEDELKGLISRVGRAATPHVLAVLDWALYCPEDIRSHFP